MNDPIPFAAVPSANPETAVDSAHRFDPFYAGIWGVGSQATWVSEHSARSQAAAGFAKLPNYLNMTADDAWASLTDDARLPKRLRTLAVLDSWRTATAEQLAAFTGQRGLATGRSGAMTELFTTGLADIGVVATSTPMSPTSRTSRATVYRPSRTDVFRTKLTPHLTYPEWVSVTAGMPFESGGQFDRHNVLTTELALRVAEYCEIGTVLGEKVSTVELLANSGAGFPAEPGSNRAADATFVRTDGARIAVEMTASAGKTFDAKVSRWAKVLANRRMADTGLMVLFVVAERPDKRVKRGETMAMVKKAVARAVRAYPGVNFDRVAERILVADWTTWFPKAGLVSPSFFGLEAERPTGPDHALWETVSTLDIFDIPFTPSNPVLAEAVLDNSGALGSVPYWLQTRQAPPLWPVTVRAAGFNRIPVPAAARPEMNVGTGLGEATAVAGPALPPRRLRAPQVHR